MAIVEIINLTKSFKDIEVIHNTSFYLNKGKVYGFVGSNGLEKLQLSKCSRDFKTRFWENNYL